MSLSDIVWAIWAGVALLTFGALEVWSGFRGEPHTLSATLRRWLGIDPRKHWRLAGAALFLGALATFGWHIVVQA